MINGALRQSDRLSAGRVGSLNEGLMRVEFVGWSDLVASKLPRSEGSKLADKHCPWSADPAGRVVT